MSPRQSDAAERIVREAMRLFAAQGYERTTIADIQAAAGLHPGSGALYKHFPSKEAVLRAGMERFVAEAERAREFMRLVELPAGEALEALVARALAVLGGERDEIRIAWRELEPFPALQEQVRRDVMQTSYRALAAWLEARSARGEIRVTDSQATAAVLLGSITMFRVFAALWGEAPGGVDDERFQRAWIELARRGLEARSPSTSADDDASSVVPPATTQVEE
jgi:AcrR family transcriptional regulator